MPGLRAASAVVAVVAAVAAACDSRGGSGWVAAADDTGDAGAPPPATAGFGHGVAPQPARRVALGGAPGAPPLAITRVIPVGGDGEPLAIVEGRTATGPAIELVEIDGAARWRDDRACAGGVRHADRAGIVCAGDAGTTGIGLDHATWTDPRRFVVADADAVVVADGDRAVVELDRATGAPGAAHILPAGIGAADVRARCAGELYAAGADGVVRRLTAAPSPRRPPRPGPPPSPADIPVLVARWATPVGVVRAIDACDPAIVVVAIAPPTTPAARATLAPAPAAAAPSRRRPARHRRRPPPPPAVPVEPDPPAPAAVVMIDRTPAIAVLALDRATGRVVGGPVLARAMWPARDGSADLELATAHGIERRPRTLAPGRVLDGTPVVGDLLDRRGDLRLVAGPPATPAGAPVAVYLLDRRGVRAVVAAPAASAALGVDHVIAAGAGAATRFAIPTDRPRALAPLPTSRPQPPISRLELPPPHPVDAAARIASAGVTLDAPTAPRIDPIDPAIVWVGGTGVVARLDLRARGWTTLPDACPPGRPIGIAIAAGAIACAAIDSATATIAVRATRPDGAPAWTWTAPALALEPAAAAIDAAGDTIALVAGDRAVVLDAATGAVVLDRRTDDGLAATAVPIRIAGAAAVIAIERDAVIARPVAAPAAAAWAIAARGTVTQLAATAADAIVVLDSIDAYRLDLATGAARPLAATADRWTIAGDLVLGDTAADDGWTVRGFGPAGERFRAAVVTDGAFAVAPTRAPGDVARVVLVRAATATAGAQVITLDPATGQLIDHLVLPDAAGPATVFATVVDGQAVAASLVFAPLAAQTF